MDFDGLVDRYEKPIYNLIYRLISDPEEAADLTQETFVSAYRSFSQFKGESTIYTWLYRIAINRCKNKFKERDRRSRYEGPSLDSAGGAESAPRTEAPADLRDAPEAQLERKEFKERIERAIAGLPYDYRIVAVLRDLQGLSYQEIAEAAGLGVDVVRTRLARARGMIRQKIEPYLAGQS